MEERPSQYEDDRTLVEACLEGSEEAWEAFQERFNGYIYSIAALPQWGFNRQDAEDICEEIYLKIIDSGLRLFRFDSSLKTYIGSIAKRVCIDRVRSARERKRRLTLSMEQDSLMGRTLDQVVESNVNVAAKVLREETIGEVNAAFRTMKEQCRQVLILRYREELSYEQIATHLDMPLGTVCSLVSRCTEKLVSLLRPTLGLAGAREKEGE